MAKQIKPSPCGSLYVADFSGSLSTYDNQFCFNQPSLSDLYTLNLHRQRHLTGSPNPHQIIAQLRNVCIFLSIFEKLLIFF